MKRLALIPALVAITAVSQASVVLTGPSFGTQLPTQVQLLWETTSEFENKAFRIERSFNGQEWIEVGSVRGQGTTVLPTQYSFTDYKPYPGINYYRLHIIDNSGGDSYSPVIMLDFGPADCGFYVYPNPATDYLLVNWEGCEVANWCLKVFKTTGELARYIDYSELTYSIIDISDLPIGDYIVIVEGKGTKTLRTRIRKNA
jgi:hypothetical protein